MQVFIGDDAKGMTLRLKIVQLTLVITATPSDTGPAAATQRPSTSVRFWAAM
jgi:hypothetical protein